MEPWLWLFPAIYFLHLAEETFAGEHFYDWIRRVSGRRIPLGAFLALNAFCMALVVEAVLTLRAGMLPWLLPAPGAITAVNGLGHLVGTIATRSYSPGAITGLMVWASLGWISLILSRSSIPIESWLFGVACGLVATGLVIGSAFLVSENAAD
jgi:hypothetical protein